MRRIFHLARCWTSTGTDVHSKTAFTAAGSDLEQLIGQITKPTLYTRDPQDLEMVDSVEEMSSYKQSQKCLFSSQAVLEVISSDLIRLRSSVVIWSPSAAGGPRKAPKWLLKAHSHLSNKCTSGDVFGIYTKQAQPDKHTHTVNRGNK